VTATAVAQSSLCAEQPTRIIDQQGSSKRFAAALQPTIR